jgi:hypothetical protein
MTTKPFQRARDIITQSASKSLPSPKRGLGRKNRVPCLLQAFLRRRRLHYPIWLTQLANTVASIEFLLPGKRWNARVRSSSLSAVVAGDECVLISVLFSSRSRCTCLMMQMRIARTGSRLRAKAAYFAHSAPLRLHTHHTTYYYIYTEPVAAAKLFAAAN